jgi:glycosyltransferase involved in cell wall biosynthesis
MKTTKRKIAIIGTNGLPARYGGFETLVEYLVKGLNKEYELYCYCSKTPKKKKLRKYLNTNLIYLPFKANGWQSMLYDTCSIVYSSCKHDVLIILGFSGSVAFPLKFIFKKTIIFNIGGIEWKKVRGLRFTSKLEIFLKKIFEYICVKSSDTVVVDNQILYDYVFDRYKMTPALVEYGGDHAVYEPLSWIIDSWPFLKSDYDVTVSRAQEDMNIHIVIEAYKSVPQRNLVIISNWEMSEYGKNLKAKNKDKYSNIFLLDAIYDLKILNAIRGNCRLYLHTHSLCGTAPSLVEAMSLGLPVICFDVSTNRASTEEKSYYFNDSQSLIAILENLDASKTSVLRKSMFEIAYRRYTWNRIISLYKRTIERNAKT